MTPNSIQSVSQSVPALPDSTAPNSSAKARPALTLAEDKVEFSSKAKAKLLKQQRIQGQKNASQVSSTDSAQGTQSESGNSQNISTTHTNIAQLSMIERAKLLKKEGDKVPQIAIELNVPPKTIEDYLELTNNSGGTGVAVPVQGTSGVGT